MMTLKTFLLISDDPDDHFEFSEALHETFADAVLISVFDSKKVLDVIRNKKVQPDIIFLDLSMPDANQLAFHEFIQSDGQANIRLIPYGTDFSSDQKERKVSSVLTKDFSYSELKDFLTRVITNN